MPPDNEVQGTLRDLFYIIFKHKGKIIAIFLTVVVSCTIATLQAPPVYEGSAKIMVKFGRENIYLATGPATGGNSRVLVDSSREERINSEIQLLQGRNLIEEVIGDIGVAKLYPSVMTEKKSLLPRTSSKKLSPLEKAILIFQKKLTVEVVENSDIIDVRFLHGNPEIAAQTLNRLIDVFLDHHLKVYKQSQEYDFFAQQVQLLGYDLNESEKKLQTFQKQNNITLLQEQKKLLLKQISDLEMGLARTLSDMSEYQAKMQALAGDPAASLREVKMGEETELNPAAISIIKEKLAELRLEEEALLGKYADQSAFVVNVRKEIEKAQAMLMREERTYHEKAITSISHTLNALKGKEKSQKELLAQYQQKLVEVNSVERELKELERQVSLNEENYQLYVKHMEEARISNAMDNQKIANISVVEAARPPIIPVSSNKGLKIILAIILGGGTGLGTAFFFEYFNQSLRNTEDVKKYFNLPVLASIPELKQYSN